MTPVFPLDAGRDPTARAYGWSDLASAVRAASDGAGSRPWVAANRYQDAAELAFGIGSVDGTADPVITALTGYFGLVEQGGLVDMRRGATRLTTRRLWLLRDWNGAWPSPGRIDSL